MKKNETLEGLMALYKFNEADLLENAEMMGYNDNHKMDHLKEPQLRKQLAKAVLDNPRQVLKRLPAEDLYLLQILKDAEPGMGMKMRHTTQMMSMAMLGLAEQVEMDDDTLETVTITEDFKQAIRPYVDEVMDDFEVRLRLHVEQFLIGALNLYGVLTRSELKTILKECLELEDDGSGMFDHIYPDSIALQMQENDGYFGDGEDFYTSPFVHDFGYIIREREKRKETATLKYFDRDVLKEAGGMPVPTIPNSVEEKLLKTLQGKMEFTKDEAYFWTFLLWRLVQEEDMSVTDVVQMVMNNVTGNGLKGMNEINEVIQVIMDFLNHAPRWNFRGRCPSDLHRPLTSAPEITIGPNMRNMGFSQEDVQRMANETWNDRFGDDFDYEPMMPFVAPPKVGRNDPCPCGSGKKYKHCCGRGN